jgi:hypothetical protein
VHAIRHTDLTGLYIILFNHGLEESELYVHACLFFRPGRTVGEPITINQLPPAARIIIAEVTRDEPPTT